MLSDKDIAAVQKAMTVALSPVLAVLAEIRDALTDGPGGVDE